MQTYFQGRGSVAIHIPSECLGALGVTRQRSLLGGIPVWGPWQVCQGRHRDFGHLQLDNANGMAPHSVVWPMPRVEAGGPLAGHSPSLPVWNCWELSFLWISGLRIGGYLFLNAREELMPAGSTCRLRALSSHHFTWD